jgi:hypothetical protein
MCISSKKLLLLMWVVCGVRGQVLAFRSAAALIVTRANSGASRMANKARCSAQLQLPNSCCAFVIMAHWH